MTGADRPPPLVLTVWAACAGAVLLVLVDAPAGVLVSCLLIASGAAVAHRRGLPPAERTNRAPSAVAVRPAPRVAPALAEPPEEWRAAPDPEEVARLTDEELCRAWRSSYLRLVRLGDEDGSAGPVARVARERSLYLDELERRHPSGFSAWLESGARAPSDPSRYLPREIPRQRRPRTDETS